MKALCVILTILTVVALVVLAAEGPSLARYTKISRM
jgi:hypothetical protein